MDDSEDNIDSSAIAIVGMSCRLPGAKNLAEYWDNLRKGVESVHFFSEEELLAAGESPEIIADPNYVRAQPKLDDFDQFDAGFWGWTPKDASVTDPAHRLFLEVGYEALEHSGHTGIDSEGPVGVFAATGASQYWMQNLQTNPNLIDEMGEFLVRHTGNDMNFLATRLSYELDLRGPSINVQTACSSGLVAIHMGIQSLLGGECDFAIAGASTILLPQGRGYLYRDGEIMSPDGHCRPFDANSAGTVFGSGAGAIVLRRYEDALADGDTIHAIIRSSAINNDGAQKVGYLAPGVEGQAGAIAEALTLGEIDVESISYVETHGTGTQVGDPIEFEALLQVFQEQTQKKGFCGIGSVKANIGHLGEAAAVASMIKVVLSLKHKTIPPSINFESPNEKLEIEDSPFFINDTLRNWEPNTGKRRAGITALGAGGTNAHIIVEEAPAPDLIEAEDRSRAILLLSAKSPSALNQASENLAAFLEKEGETSLTDAAYTLQQGRRALPFRRAIACQNREEAISLLRKSDTQRIADGKSEGREPSLVFMFPGGGAQYSGMGRDLYQEEPVYQSAFDEALSSLEPDLEKRIKELVFANTREATQELERPSLALPALLATEYALAQLLEAWGATPTAFIGHSMGEYTAACLAGVMSLGDAIRLVHKRGELFETIERGGMLSITLPASEARQKMPESLDFAAINAPDLCVASGPVEAIEQFQASLEADEVDCVRVHIDVAAHSSMLEPILGAFREFCQTISFAKPRIPFVSNLTGNWIQDSEATDPEYWVQHLRNTVRFADNVATVLKDDSRVLVEIGPGRTLASLAKAGAEKSADAFNSMRHPKEAQSDVEFALRTLGRIWATGAPIDWSRFWGDEPRKRVPLPTYPFERQSYWIKPGDVSSPKSDVSKPLKKRPLIDDWFGVFNWSQQGAPKPSETIEDHWLVFADQASTWDSIVAGMRDIPRTILVKRGSQYKEVSENEYEITAASESDFEKLLEALKQKEAFPQRIVYLWSLDENAAIPSSNGNVSLDRLQNLKISQENSFWGLFRLGKALGSCDKPVRLSVLSASIHSIAGEAANPEGATLLGPVTVLPREFPFIETQSIDVAMDEDPRRIHGQIAQELQANIFEPIVAFRKGRRWTRQIEASHVGKASPDCPWTRRGGSFLITGGLGGIGLEMARFLSRKGAGTLILLGRSGLPPRNEWSQYVESHSPDDRDYQRMKSILEIEAQGAKVEIAIADLSCPVTSQSALSQIRTSLGPIHGIIHAAGAMDDQLLAIKTEESASSVLAPKLAGTLALDAAFSDTELDFFVVFSSVASFLGLPGQIDYAGANAFLDAFVAERSTRAKGKSLAINWNAWRGIGMAERSHRESLQSGGRGMKGTTPHPALDSVTETSSGGLLFETTFSVAQHWLLSEHVVKGGEALIPGTGFIELLRAAATIALPLQSRTSPAALILEDVQFFSPFQVHRLEQKLMKISVETDGDAYLLSLYSGEEEDLPHVTATARVFSGEAGSPLDLDSIRSRCPEVGSTRGTFLDQDFMDFGPRWGCIQSVHYGKGESILEIALDERFSSDLDGYQIHPALLDMATGGAQRTIDGFSPETDFYVPIGYSTLIFHKAMPAAFTSHVQCTTNDGETASFDINLADPTGYRFLEVKGFTMKKVALGSFSAPSSQSGDHSAHTEADPLEAILNEAILPHEGLEAFDRVMSDWGSSQWIISSVDSKRWKQQLDAESQKDSQAETSGVEGASRPDVLTDYLAPRNETEQKIADIWQVVLGVKEVGVEDDFFELGGHSLLLTRAAARIRKELSVNLPLNTMFNAPTISQLATKIDEFRNETKSDAAMPELKALSRQKFRVKRTPLTR